MKPYFGDINAWLFLLYIFNWLICYLTLYFVSRKYLVADKFNLYYYLFLLSFYSIILILDFRVKVLPFFPDTYAYSEIITGESNLFINSTGVSFFYKVLTYPFTLVSCQSVFVYMNYNILFNHLGLMFVWYAWQNVKKVNTFEQRIYLLLCLTYPLVTIYSLVPLRESMFILSFGLFFIGITKKKLINHYLILGTVLIYIVRNEYILIIVILVFLKLFNMKNILKFKSVLVLLIIFPVLFHLVNYFSTNFLNIIISPKSLEALRNIRFSNYSDTGLAYPMVSWDSWLSLIKDIPLLFLQFILAPFPILLKYNFTNQLTYLLDGIFVSLIFVLLLLRLKYYIKSYPLWLLYIFITLLLTSIFEFFITSAVRHRYPSIVLLLPLISSIIGKSSFFKKIIE